ncbi:spore germination protein [Paenibacillus aestuarii]|uniref:Spore germination protein n=2 Tax=Paenibacillus aestuarii TaxID=516965 RepID=A0ABW0KCB6_9BACL|nr:spore germination protein [Paenibacillus aestuarii]
MPNVFNIINIRINEVATGGVVNFGDNLLRGNAANSKAVGGNTVIGDATSSVNADRNNVFDPDISDQGNSNLV